MKPEKIALKGPFLPEIGGVSIHISRLAEALYNDQLLYCVFTNSNLGSYNESRFTVINAHFPNIRYTILKSLLWFIRYGIFSHYKIIHIHSHPIWESPIFFLLVLLRKKIVFTIHDQIMLSNLDQYPKLLVYLFKKGLGSKNIYWVVVNHKIQNQIEKLISRKTKISIIPAYLPALNNFVPLNQEIDLYISNKSRVVTIYAHSVRQINGKDLYGIDIALKSISLVKEHYIDIGLIVCIPNTPDPTQVENYTMIIERLNLKNNVLLFLKPVSNPDLLWRKSDVVIRPTLSDGDSLIVREALSQGTPVIASDIVERPQDVILFKSEDIKDLSQKILETIQKPKIKMGNSLNSNYDLIKKIYLSFYL